MLLLRETWCSVCDDGLVYFTQPPAKTINPRKLPTQLQRVNASAPGAAARGLYTAVWLAPSYTLVFETLWGEPVCGLIQQRTAVLRTGGLDDDEAKVCDARIMPTQLTRVDTLVTHADVATLWLEPGV